MAWVAELISRDRSNICYGHGHHVQSEVHQTQDKGYKRLTRMASALKQGRVPLLGTVRSLDHRNIFPDIIQEFDR